MPLFKKQPAKKSEFKKIEPSKVKMEEDYDDYEEYTKEFEPDYEEERMNREKEEIQKLKKLLNEKDRELQLSKQRDSENRFEIKEIPIQTTKVIVDKKTNEQIDIYQVILDLLNRE